MMLEVRGIYSTFLAIACVTRAVLLKLNISRANIDVLSRL